MVPEFIHTDRRSPTMYDPAKTAEKADKNGRQVQLLTEAVNILANRLAKVQMQLAERNPTTEKRGPGRPPKNAADSEV